MGGGASKTVRAQAEPGHEGKEPLNPFDYFATMLSSSSPDRDYHEYTSIDMPKEERRRWNLGDYWINAVEWSKSGEFVRSMYEHDYRSCSCGNISVDGGSWYIKRVGNMQPGAWIERAVTFTDAEPEDGVKRAKAGTTRIAERDRTAD